MSQRRKNQICPRFQLFTLLLNGISRKERHAFTVTRRASPLIHVIVPTGADVGVSRVVVDIEASEVVEAIEGVDVAGEVPRIRGLGLEAGVKEDRVLVGGDIGYGDI